MAPGTESDPPKGADPNAKSPTPANGGHIVSNRAWRIRALGQEVATAATNRIQPAKEAVSAAHVGVPGFSIIGLPLEFAHSSLKGEADGHLTKATQTLQSWQDGLDTVAQTWDKAEQSSTFQHTK